MLAAGTELVGCSPVCGLHLNLSGTEPEIWNQKPFVRKRAANLQSTVHPPQSQIFVFTSLPCSLAGLSGKGWRVCIVNTTPTWSCQCGCFAWCWGGRGMYLVCCAVRLRLPATAMHPPAKFCPVLSRTVGTQLRVESSNHSSG